MLATSLGNLGKELSALGSRKEALTASLEAMEIYRQLTEKEPASFLPELALNLNNLGVYLGSLGLREQALAATQEAVEIYQSLAETLPDAFLPNLATGLVNLGKDLSIWLAGIMR